MIIVKALSINQLTNNVCDGILLSMFLIVILVYP